MWSSDLIICRAILMVIRTLAVPLAESLIGLPMVSLRWMVRNIPWRLTMLPIICMVGIKALIKRSGQLKKLIRQSIKMVYTSPDGEEDYPGQLTATVVYSLSDDNTLQIEMSATTDATTIVNLVNHSYWNLAGHDSGDILSHELMLNAPAYTPVDSTFIPTGTIDSVKKNAIRLYQNQINRSGHRRTDWRWDKTIQVDTTSTLS